VAVSRFYTVDSGLQAVTTATITPVLCGTTSSSTVADIVAIRVGVFSGSSVVYPTNGTVLVQLQRPTGTAAGGGSVTPSPHNVTDIAARTTWLAGSTGTAVTGLTPATILWGQVIPFAAGANWAEWDQPGAEWRLGASANICVYVTTSAASTATDFSVELVFSE
jgi:hypothetical protein